MDGFPLTPNRATFTIYPADSLVTPQRCEKSVEFVNFLMKTTL